jgi:hypothetical protein
MRRTIRVCGLALASFVLGLTFSLTHIARFFLIVEAA